MHHVFCSQNYIILLPLTQLLKPAPTPMVLLSWRILWSSCALAQVHALPSPPPHNSKTPVPEHGDPAAVDADSD